MCCTHIKTNRLQKKCFSLLVIAMIVLLFLYNVFSIVVVVVGILRRLPVNNAFMLTHFTVTYTKFQRFKSLYFVSVYTMHKLNSSSWFGEIKFLLSQSFFVQLMNEDEWERDRGRERKIVWERDWRQKKQWQRNSRCDVELVPLFTLRSIHFVETTF